MSELSELAARAANRVVNAFGGDAFQLSPKVRHGKIDRLYEMAKRDQWNASDRFPSMAPLDGGSLTAHERQAICRVFSQLYYGERGAQVISGQLCTMVGDNEAAKFLSSQCMDEARHVEVFERMLLRIERIYPMNPFLNALLTDMMRTERLEEKLLGMNLLIEGLAITVFKFSVRLFEREPRYQNELGHHLYESVQLILKDESRHVGFGTLYLPHVLSRLSARRARELEARQLVWMGLLFGSVRYHKRDAEVVGIPYLEILSELLEEHQTRVREMGVEGLVSGERLAQIVPFVDKVIDRVGALAA